MGELLDGGVGELVLFGVVEVLEVLGDTGVGFGDEGYAVVVSVGVDGLFELPKGEVVDRSCGLVGAVEVGGAFIVLYGAEPADAAEALEAGVGDVAGDAEGLLELSGAEGWLAAAEAFGDV